MTADLDQDSHFSGGHWAVLPLSPSARALFLALVAVRHCVYFTVTVCQFVSFVFVNSSVPE
jgi:hypothetical protein